MTLLNPKRSCRQPRARLAPQLREAEKADIRVRVRTWPAEASKHVRYLPSERWMTRDPHLYRGDQHYTRGDAAKPMFQIGTRPSALGAGGAIS